MQRGLLSRNATSPALHHQSIGKLLPGTGPCAGLSLALARLSHALAPVAQKELLLCGQEGVGGADQGAEGGGHLQHDEQEKHLVVFCHPDGSMSLAT